jgi:N-acetyl-gamma-glutamylphosphate reductase
MGINVWVGLEEGLEARLRTHPDVAIVGKIEARGLDFEQHGRRRSVRPDLRAPLAGLPEMMDNNPLVCADEAAVPSPAGTLALIAVGPLIRAGLLVEAPTLIFSFEASESEVEDALSTEGWYEGATVAFERAELQSVCAMTAMAVVNTQELASLDELDDLYDEAFGRSFFVRRDEDSTWDPPLVEGQAHAVYRLRILPDEPYSLLTIQVLADRHGKLGAAQLVHQMNIMAGFEESLGIA